MADTFSSTFRIQVNHATREHPEPKWRTHTVSVDVDAHGLAQWLGTKAARSKGRKAIEASGCVVVKVVE